MSFEATSWALKQCHLKPATKTVLFCLAERHNPKMGCFPSHARLAADACMSERSVRNHLARLEALGLIRRIRGTGGKHKREATRYLFPFEDHFEAPGNCQRQTESTARNPQSRRQNLPTNPVMESIKEETARNPGGSPDLLEKVMRALGLDPSGRNSHWWAKETARAHVASWMEKHGLNEAEIVQVACESRKTHPSPPDGPKALDRFMERWARKQDGAGRSMPRRLSETSDPAATLEEQLLQLAGWITSGRYVPPSAASPSKLRELLDRGMVTEQELQSSNLM